MDYGRLLDFIFPRACLACGMYITHGVLCGKCEKSIYLHNTLFCGTCRARLPHGKRICHTNVPYILGAATEYESKSIRAVIHGLKFDRIREAAKFLGEILSTYASSLPLPKEGLVLPIPLGRRRERERGFNQSALVAQIFAERCGLTYAPKAIVRIRETKPQSHLREIEKRKENVERCFEVQKGWVIPPLPIFLIDDVTTSGATLFEAASALRAHGAKQIYGLTVTKA